MALRNILVFPDPRLREVAEEVKVFDEKLKTLSADLLETMYAVSYTHLTLPTICSV